jgi:hypothetical protein
MPSFLTGAQIIKIPYQISVCCTFKSSNGTTIVTTTGTTQALFADLFTEANDYYSIAGNGNCLLSNPTTPLSGYSGGSVPITQSMDLCDLAVSGFLRLEEGSLGICRL